MIRALVLALSVISLVAATPAGATTFLWRFLVTEDQVNNATPDGGSTGSSATGMATFHYDDAADVMEYSVTYTGLEGELTAMHIHGPSTPDISVTGHLWDIFTLGADIPDGIDRHSDTVEGAIEDFLGRAPCDLNELVCTDPDAALAAMVADQGYLNIHSDRWPRGEIRGNLVMVPEPSTVALVLFGTAMLGAAGRRRRSQAG